MKCSTCHKLTYVLLFHFSLLRSIELCARRLRTVIMQAPHPLILWKLLITEFQLKDFHSIIRGREERHYFQSHSILAVLYIEIDKHLLAKSRTQTWDLIKCSPTRSFLILDPKTMLILDHEQYMADKGKLQLKILQMKWIEYTHFIIYMYMY